MAYLLALDQGTSSSRSIVFRDGAVVATAQQEFPQLFPQPGWVEHDPDELWRSQLATAREVLAKAGLKASDIAALGITNQRETTVVWERATGRPIFNAIVWQDRRTEALCQQLRTDGLAEAIRAKTGLVLDPYFSATKLKWILDNVDGARARAERGELAFGTVDSWLAWNLTGGREHVTDVSNAARTMLWNIHERCWDAELLAWLDIPAELLPQVHPSSHLFGMTDAQWLGREVCIGGIAGDQQAALFGQACFQPGMAKNTYGTGCFMLLNTGGECAASNNGLISTAACEAQGRHQYALEGSVFIGGAVVQWLRDGLKAIKSASEIEALAASVPDAGGVVFVPSFTGLGAPYWVPSAKGAMFGLSRGTTVAHIARAALESIAFQSAALLQAMQRDAAAPITELRVDGGACANSLLLQFQADLLGIPVVRPVVTETTALGAASLAGLAAGVYRGTDDLAAQWRVDRVFEPATDRAEALRRVQGWEHAVTQLRSGCAEPAAFVA
ncbi:glycerol kinase GlpK [Pseudoduganella chitinolytica]|uniref:Glycerol kinase n=1 Tax=Pseudoduganella chitinolytica TaxID=34070 RepID=A0ABY8BAT9_9BURK|nr:glycerol kinase GlpK [Pseudoduganella chitinolytica]WEF32831.1 glycerol kinase GlpK [Pseudoduganella chitinolytica]